MADETQASEVEPAAEPAPEPTPEPTDEQPGILGPKLDKEEVDDAEANLHPSAAKEPLVEDMAQPVGDPATTGPAQEPVHYVSPPAADPDAINATLAEQGEDHPDAIEDDPSSPNYGKRRYPKQEVEVPDHGDLSEDGANKVALLLKQAYESMGTVWELDEFGRLWWAQYQIINNQSVIVVRLSRADGVPYETMLSTSVFSLDPAEVEEGEEPNPDPVIGAIMSISGNLK